MARIPAEEIERLKREIPVQGLVEARGVKLSPHGAADLVGLCPYHADTTPSLVVSPGKNLWNCLGACNTGGSVIDWVMKDRGVSFRHAVEILRTGHGVEASAVRPRCKDAGKCVLPQLVAREAEDHELLAQVVGYYHETLAQSPEALSYLERRGLSHPEMIDHFKLGFSNRTLSYRLPLGNRATGARIRGKLQALGILRETGHEHFAGSVVIPVFAEDGTVAQMYGRKVTPNLRPGTAQHLYLRGPLRGVWNLEGLNGRREAILCEALIDALTFWCAGFRNVTASFGTGGFTQDHLAAFQRLGVERVLIAYDRDEAGEKAALALAAKLSPEGIECLQVLFPKGMDANDYACRVKPAEKSLELVLAKAVPLAHGLAATAGLVPGKRTLTQVAPAPEAAPLPSPPATQMPACAPTPPEASAIAGDALPASPGPASSTDVAAPAAPAPDTARVTPETATVCVATGGVAAHEDPPRSEHPAPPAVPVDATGDELVIHVGDRRYRVRGLARNTTYETMKVNVLAASGSGFHVDTLDLYSARLRQAFAKQAATEMAVEEDTVRHDLGKVLLKLEELQEQEIRKALEPRAPAVTLSEEERAQAMELLQDPHLLDRILADFTSCGIVGEETNKLVGYLAAVSRKLEDPLAVIVQSSSAAGKSSLMEAFLSFVPEEDRVKYSAMTGQSLFYMGERDLAHKILAIVEEEGAERASYALKLLQTEGELTIASTGKDPATGRLVTQEYRVQGPVMILLTTTAVEVDEELLNRCVVLTVNEDREQTRAIHQLQRESQTLEGLLARRDRDRVVKVHRNAQRLLRSVLVANPFARSLTFLDDKTRMRRDHLKYLALIRAIALLHQYQRPKQSARTRDGQAIEYVEVTPSDIAVANRLAHEVLGRSLDDLAPQTRRLLSLLDQMVTEACRKQELDRAEYRFSRRDVREHTRWGDTRVKVHLRRLEELEYVLPHRGHRGQSIVYELLYDGKGQDGTPFLMGLIDVDRLAPAGTTAQGHPPAPVDRGYDADQAGQNGGVAGQNGGSADRRRPLVRPKAGGGQGSGVVPDGSRGADLGASEPESGENAHLDEKSLPSYVPTGRTRRQPALQLASLPDEPGPRRVD